MKSLNVYRAPLRKNDFSLSFLFKGQNGLAVQVKQYTCIYKYSFIKTKHPNNFVWMAERSKALRSGRSPLLWAWVRIPLQTNLFPKCNNMSENQCRCCLQIIYWDYADSSYSFQCCEVTWRRRLPRRPRWQSGNIFFETGYARFYHHGLIVWRKLTE